MFKERIRHRQRAFRQSTGGLVSDATLSYGEVSADTQTDGSRTSDLGLKQRRRLNRTLISTGQKWACHSPRQQLSARNPFGARDNELRAVGLIRMWARRIRAFGSWNDVLQTSRSSLCFHTPPFPGLFSSACRASSLSASAFRIIV
jgi:hypothetical protein